MAKGKAGIIGSGMVAQALGDGFLKKGWEVTLGTSKPEKLAAWKAKAGASAKVGTFAQAAEFGTLLVLAVKGGAAEDAVKKAGVDKLAGKTVLDTCNPITEAAPVNGVLQYFTGPNESLMERLQKLAPKARFVKAFSCIGSDLMVDPKLPGGKPTMFICGNDAGAKKEASALIESFGFELADMGGVEAARAIEPLAMLWCIPGFKDNDWAHAFKLLKA
jgi:predicted dinucleotide-binding enzyme